MILGQSSFPKDEALRMAQARRKREREHLHKTTTRLKGRLYLYVQTHTTSKSLLFYLIHRVPQPCGTNKYVQALQVIILNSAYCTIKFTNLLQHYLILPCKSYTCIAGSLSAEHYL
jgi:hypothetical protein